MSKRVSKLCGFASKVAGLKFCSEHCKCEDCPMFYDEEMLKHEDGRTCNADVYVSGFLDGILISRFGYRRKLRRMMKEQGENFKFYDSPRMFKQRLMEKEEELTEKLKQYMIEHSND